MTDIDLFNLELLPKAFPPSDNDLFIHYGKHTLDR